MSDEHRPAIPFEDLLAMLPEDERRRAEERGRREVEDYRDLKELREALDQTQAQVGERLGVNPPAVSKLERRADLYVSTLRKVVGAMGGRLDILVRFPGRPPVRLGRFNGEDARPIRARRAASAAAEADAPAE